MITWLDAITQVIGWLYLAALVIMLTVLGIALLVAYWFAWWPPRQRPQLEPPVDPADVWRHGAGSIAPARQSCQAEGLGPRISRQTHSPCVPLWSFDESAQRALEDLGVWGREGAA